MLTAFDHLIVAVRDLRRASEAFQRLGFDVRPGGRNPGNGTYNAIVRFGVDYIELLSIEDETLANDRAPRGNELSDYLRAHEAGAIGYVVQSDDIEADAERAALAGFADVGVPIEMRRARPDGSEFSWRLLIPGARAFRQPWPLLIQWTTSDRERLAAEPPGRHANGALGICGLVVAVRSMSPASALYEDQLGLTIRPRDRSATLAAVMAAAEIGAVELTLAAPDGDGPVAREVLSQGQGPYQVDLNVDDISATEALFRKRGVPFGIRPGGAVEVDPSSSNGLRIVFHRHGGPRH